MATAFQNRLILASRSPRRAGLLQGVGIPFEVIPSDISEPPPAPAEQPAEYAGRLAEAKAWAVCENLPARNQAGAYVLGADTIVVLGEEILGQPADPAEALTMLKRLTGRTHHVISAWCLLRCDDGVARTGHADTAVTFATVSEDVLRAYIETGEPTDKAGAYGIQGIGSFLVREIHGSYTNVVGLPLDEVLAELESFAQLRPWGP